MKKQAFTLIELIVTVTIIAVITAAGIASFSTLVPRRLEAEARKIVSDLCWAREMAVARHQNYIVDFDTTNERYIIYRGSINPNNQVKYQNLEVDLISVTDFFGTPVSTQITFSFPRGTAQDRLINLSYQGQSRAVIVFRETGYVRMQ